MIEKTGPDLTTRLNVLSAKDQTALNTWLKDQLAASEPQFEFAVWEESASGLPPSHVRNEDEKFVDPDHGLAMIFDGVTGGGHGKEAAEAAKNFLSRAWELTTPKHPQSQETGMRRALTEASSQVTQGSTTAVVARLLPIADTVYAVIGWVGDSRAYVFRAKEGKLDKLTEDHDRIWSRLKDSKFPPEQRDRMREIVAGVPCYITTREPDGSPSPDPQAEFQFAKELFDEGIILESERSSFETHEFVCWRSAVSQYLRRGRFIDSSILTTQLFAGDRLILTTDGVYKAFTVPELQEFISAAHPDLAKALVSEAKSRGSSDDATAVAMEVKRKPQLPLFSSERFIRPPLVYRDNVASDAISQYRERAALRGIREVQAGQWLKADGIEYDFQGERGRVPIADEFEGKRQRARLGGDHVGHFAVNGGLIAFVNYDGELFVGKYSDQNRLALEQAGYREDRNLAVPFSHGERIVDWKIRMQLERLKMSE